MHLLIMRLLIAVVGVAFVSLLVPAFAEMNIDVVVDGLNNPWEMVFTPNGDIYFSERDGRIWNCLLYTSDAADE